jgi:glycosyltransferase involved in cell wall biosynthesis
MTILYNYITVASEGGSVHIHAFVKACRSLGEIVIENGVNVAPYLGGKDAWSMGKRLMVKLGWFLENVRHFWRTWCIARTHKPDVLLFRFQPLHELFLSIVGMSYLYPVILEINAVRSIEHSEGRPRISDFLDRLSLARARRVFVVSQRLKEHLVAHFKLDAERIAVIENGVDPDEFHPAVSRPKRGHELPVKERFVIGFIGSFRPWHAIDHLIAVAEQVVPKLPTVLFLLVGDGADRPLYEKKVQGMGLDKYFYFTGRVAHDEVPGYLASMDVVMAPVMKKSFVGGFHGSPLKIFEYMAMAKAVIAPPLGQICKAIENGVSGLLINSEDTPELTQAILRLYGDPMLREQLGRNARARVMERYTWKLNAEKVRCLCSEACHGR